MDCVILAAGKGSRLDGITAPYHKPLLVVNGKSLIAHAVDHALAYCRKVIVVVAPENALPISQVLGERHVKMIVQRRPGGPGAALRLALGLVTSSHVLVLMADNLFGPDDIADVVGTDTHSSAVGVTPVDAELARRLTWRRTDGTWFEKVAPTPEDGTSVLAWVGPLKLDVVEIARAIDSWGEQGECPIDPLLNQCKIDKLVSVNTLDIGVPEALA